MTSERRLVYDFMGLPWHWQLEVVRELGLNEPDGTGPGDQQARILWFKRASERGLIARMRLAVSRAMRKVG